MLVKKKLGLLGLVDAGVILENINMVVVLASENMEVVVSGLSLADMHFLGHTYISNTGRGASLPNLSCDSVPNWT